MAENKFDRIMFDGSFIVDYIEGQSKYYPGEYIRYAAYRLESGEYLILTDYQNNIDGQIHKEIISRKFKSIFAIECSEHYPDTFIDWIADKMGIPD